ncbi:hypothetical protein PInf_011377 [Phytophthora infestans]|nr:hypothetical protein PInf_011377 [Phytophthora infestans]
MDPPPLRTSKRAASSGKTAVALTEVRKSKKKATKRTPAANTGHQKSDDDEDNTPPDQQLEDIVAPLKSKSGGPGDVQLPVSSLFEATSTCQGFDLTSFMLSLDPGYATAMDNTGTPESRLEDKAGEVSATTLQGPGKNVMAELHAL